MLLTLIVSPHLDDAVLSCAGELLSCGERGEATAVLSLFTAGSRSYRVRRREDRAALRSLGARALHAGLLDAPFRLPFEGRPSLATLLTTEPRAEDVAAAREAVAKTIAELRPTRVLFALGIGGHVDHRAAYQCANVADAPLFYEDRPYAFVPALLAHRRHQIEGGRAAALVSRETVRRQLVEAPWTDDSVAEWSEVIAAELAETRPRTDVALRCIQESEHAERADAITNAIEAYGSQRRWLFGERDVGAWWRAAGGMRERLFARSDARVAGEMPQQFLGPRSDHE